MSLAEDIPGPLSNWRWISQVPCPGERGLVGPMSTGVCQVPYLGGWGGCTIPCDLSHVMHVMLPNLTPLWTDTCLWQHYLPATIVASSKNKACRSKTNCPLNNRWESRGSHVVTSGLEGWGPQVNKFEQVQRSQYGREASHVACYWPLASWAVVTLETPCELTDRHEWKLYLPSDCVSRR